MPKRVTMVAEILGDRCTGCRLCAQVCPTVAITMRSRTDQEIGPGKNIAVLHDEHCYNVQACLEICPDEAIAMRALDEPLRVAHGYRRNVVDRLVGVQLRALSAGALQSVDDVGLDAAEDTLHSWWNRWLDQYDAAMAIGHRVLEKRSGAKCLDWSNWPPT